MVRHKEYYQQNEQLIKHFSHKIQKPNVNIKYETINTNSWFDIKHKKFKQSSKITIADTNDYDEIYNKCEKYELILDKKQQTIMLHWMDICTLMYNATIKYFKNKQFKNEQIKPNFINVRKDLKLIKNELIKKSIVLKYTDTQIRTHMLDEMINLVCENIKKSIVKLKQHKIKQLRFRYIKDTKPSKIIKIEPGFIGKNNTICESVFGEDILVSSGYDLHNINSTFTIKYNKNNKRFSLLVPTEEKVIKEKSIHKWISLDPGVRTFLTGISDDSVVKIGNNLTSKIKKYLDKTDTINKSKMPKRIKNRYNRILNEKITGTIDDLHWKTINYLTSNYRNIIIGNLSTLKQKHSFCLSLCHLTMSNDFLILFVLQIISKSQSAKLIGVPKIFLKIESQILIR